MGREFARFLLFASVLLVSLTATDTADAHGFNSCAIHSLTSSSAGAQANIQVQVGIGVGGDCAKGTGDDAVSYNVDQLIAMTPRSWGVARDADIPDGTIAGSLSTVAQLSLLNNPCNTVIPLSFTLLDGTVNSLNTLNPNAPGTPNRLTPLAQDSNPANGIPDGADRWPAYLTTVASSNGWPLARIRARLFGVNTSIPGTTTIANLLVFEPGTSPANVMGIDYRLGYPTVLVLNDPTAPGSAQDATSDLCAPLVGQFTAQGMAGATPYRTNAGDGAYDFVTITNSQRDADEDGIENRLDSCPLTADPTWNPRAVSAGDSDGDGIPGSCDPFPSVDSTCTAGTGVSFSDEDCDSWDNRADNCALISNAGQADSDYDGIGDSCDPNASTPNGHSHLDCNMTQVIVGAGGAPGPDPQTLQPCNPNAALPTDADGDGAWSDTDNCPLWPNPAQNLPAWSVPAGDGDCDGFPDAVTAAPRGNEAFIGTDPADQCADTTTVNDERGPAFAEPVSPWPPDFNDNRTTSLADVILMGPSYNRTAPDPLYKPRFDLNASGGVSLADVILMGPFYNRSCTP